MIFHPLPATGIGAPPGTLRVQFTGKFTGIVVDSQILPVMLNGFFGIHQVIFSRVTSDSDEVFFS